VLWSVHWGCYYSLPHYYCVMAADARVLLARAQTQPFPPLSTIDRFENGGLPVQLVLYQQTLVLYRIFTKTLREECSGGVRERAWVKFGLRQAVKKTASTCDNLVWLTCARRVHPASHRTQLLPRVCAPGNRHGVRRSPRHVTAGKGQPLRFR
jgi:hypothetical protein